MHEFDLQTQLTPVNGKR